MSGAFFVDFRLGYGINKVLKYIISRKYYNYE